MNSPTSIGGRIIRWLRRIWQVIKAVGIATLFVAGSTFILLFPVLPSSRPYAIQVGDIAPENILAPREITFVSQLETQAARDAAAASVSDVYDPPDPRIGRQQVRLARQIMEFTRDVRADSIAPGDLKRSYLNEVTALRATPDLLDLLISVNEEQFDLLDREIATLLEDAMGGAVREGHVQDVTRTMELNVSSNLPEPLIPLALAIARNLVVPNSRLDAAATEAQRAEAVRAVPEIRHSYQTGEVIVRAGEPVDALDYEAMIALGLTNAEITWQAALSALLASVVAATILALHLAAQRPAWAANLSHVRLVAGLLLVFLLGAQIIVPEQQPIAYLFPAAALAMALRALIGLEFAALSSIVLAGLVGYLARGSLELATYAAVSSLLAAASLHQRGRLSAFFRAGMVGAVGGVAVILMFRLPTQNLSATGGQLLLLAMLNGLFSTGITLVILVAVGGLTTLVTGLQLIDLMRPDHPLQRRLQQEALGTYQHTLAVANLVEEAAHAIGADSLLARVGTLYHDIGKLNNPPFFIENRIEGGENPYDRLDPAESVNVIKAHIKNGMALARKYHLPVQVAAFISEHHGTMPVSFFLERARKDAAAAGVELDESDYYYQGPRPSSRETAILMLADGCESSVRANRPANAGEMEAIIGNIFQQRMDLGQLDESGLTLNDLQIIRESFVRTLRGMYHPRIHYPGFDHSAKQAEPDTVGAVMRGSQSDVTELGTK